MRGLPLAKLTCTGANLRVLEKTVRVLFQIRPAFECARLVIDIVCHESRRGFSRHDTPFSSSWKICASQTARCGILD
jgi:hypothetical protein